MPSVASQPYLTVAQAAELLQLHPVTVRLMIRRGDLYAVRPGRHYRIPPEAIASLPRRTAGLSAQPAT